MLKQRNLSLAIIINGFGLYYYYYYAYVVFVIIRHDQLRYVLNSARHALHVTVNKVDAFTKNTNSAILNIQCTVQVTTLP